MAYVEQGAQTNISVAIAGVIAIHAGMGYVLVTGLSSVIQLLDPPPPLVGTTVIDLPPPPKPEDPKPEVNDPAPTQNSVVVTPRPEIDIPQIPPTFGTTDFIDDLAGDLVIKVPPREVVGTGTGGVEISKFDPVSARPKNNPGDWVTQSDYRSSWINREYTGLAKFKLTVGANGKVENCQITASTGHSALDQATCKLVERRARFDAARNSNGEKVPGTYTNAVRWVLPD